jgi:hypothetical protein
MLLPIIAHHQKSKPKPQRKHFTSIINILLKRDYTIGNKDRLNTNVIKLSYKIIDSISKLN